MPKRLQKSGKPTKPHQKIQNHHTYNIIIPLQTTLKQLQQTSQHQHLILSTLWRLWPQSHKCLWAKCQNPSTSRFFGVSGYFLKHSQRWIHSATLSFCGLRWSFFPFHRQRALATPWPSNDGASGGEHRLCMPVIKPVQECSGGSEGFGWGWFWVDFHEISGVLWGLFETS